MYNEHIQREKTFEDSGHTYRHVPLKHSPWNEIRAKPRSQAIAMDTAQSSFSRLQPIMVASEWDWSFCLHWPLPADRVSNLQQDNLQKGRTPQTPLHQPQPQPVKCDYGGDCSELDPVVYQKPSYLCAPRGLNINPIAMLWFSPCSWDTNCVQTTHSWVYQTSEPCSSFRVDLCWGMRLWKASVPMVFKSVLSKTEGRVQQDSEREVHFG